MKNFGINLRTSKNSEKELRSHLGAHIDKKLI